MDGQRTRSTWIEQCRLELQSHHSSIILLDDGRWGSQTICQELRSHGGTLVWLELDQAEAGDLCAQSKKFVTAVNAAIAKPLLSESTAFQQNIAKLQQALSIISPMTIVVAAADHAPAFAQQLLCLQSATCQLIIQFCRVQADFELPVGARVLGEDFFRLSQEQALELAPELKPAEVVRIYAASQGAYGVFMDLLSESPVRPERLTPVLLAGEDYLSLFQLLVEKESYVEALELAVSHCPQEVSWLLTEKSRHFWAQAEPSCLYGLLNKVPRLHRDATVLMWQLAMALQIAKETELVDEVEAFLERQPDPELRAFFAAAKRRSGDPEGYLFQAEQAVFSKRTVITLVHYGSALMLTDPEKGVEVLEDALRLAEIQKRFYWASLCALKLSEQFTMMGKYAYAKDYAQWGLKLQRSKINNAALHLRLINEWAFVSMLSDDTIGLETVFEDELKELEKALPEIKQLVKGTLADYYLSQQQKDKAFEIYQDLWLDNVRRENYGVLALHYVRSLVEVGRCDEALKIAKEAVRLTQQLSIRVRRDAKLAYGMALAMVSPNKAIDTLRTSVEEFSRPHVAYRKARAALYLAYSYLQNCEKRQAKEVLLNSGDCLAELTKGGLAYMAGPEVLMAATFALLEHAAESRPLEIYALREAMVVYQGQLLNLRPRQLEILVVLALHPEGLTGEQLTLAVYGEAAKVSVCKNEINRLRKVGLPIDNRPYRLDLPVWADFLELVQLLEENRISEAVDYFHQPLLNHSEAPTIASHRDLLEEMLRQAVIEAKNKDALHTLATRLKNDLMLWEAVEEQLPEGDFRRPLAQAHSEKLKNDWFN